MFNQSDQVFYLYKLTNTVNGKSYIGVTKNPNLRKRQHLTKTTVKSLVCKAVKKYGKENFKFEVLCIGSKAYICDLEQKAIILYNSHAVFGHGYNLADGGYGGSSPRRGKVKSRKDDIPVFVTGFWFPNKRTALATLGWTESKFRYRRDKKVLGDLVVFSETSTNRNSIEMPCYYRGFWFPSIKIASDLYSMHIAAIKKDLKNRRYEEEHSQQNYKIVRKLLIEGQVYDSLKDAAEILGTTKVALKGRYDRKLLNYSHTYQKEVI